jgi:single-stranded DNA-binding protein
MSKSTSQKVIIVGVVYGTPKIINRQDRHFLLINVRTERATKDKETGVMKIVDDIHRVMVRGLRAKRIGAKLRRGDKVYVEGVLNYYITKIEDRVFRDAEIYPIDIRIL